MSEVSAAAEPITGVRFMVGDALTSLRAMPTGSVDCLITSVPYHLQRAYLPPDHPNKHLESGQEATPDAFIENLLLVMDEVYRVLVDWGTFWVNLGDKHAGAGGSGGDYDEGGLREGQGRWQGVTAVMQATLANGERSHTPWRGQKPGWPMDQSVAWEPYLFAASLAYGRNLLTGASHRQWVTRPPVTWCKPSVSPGALKRRFRTATEMVIYGGKRQDHFFDLDAVRTEPKYGEVLEGRSAHSITGIPGQTDQQVNPSTEGGRINANPAGSPPLNWWVIGHGAGYAEAHFATFPAELLEKPIKAGCPALVCLDCSQPVERVVETDRQAEGVLDRTTQQARKTGAFFQYAEGVGTTRIAKGWSCLCSTTAEPTTGRRTRPGLILDPYAGSGTTGMAAVNHGRAALLVDLDERNLELVRGRVGMFLEEDG